MRAKPLDGVHSYHYNSQEEIHTVNGSGYHKFEENDNGRKNGWKKKIRGNMRSHEARII